MIGPRRWISTYLQGLALQLYPFRRGRKSLIRSLSKRMPGAVIFTGQFGIRYLLDARNYIDQKILRDGVYEGDGIAAFCEGVRACGCDLFLDIGANIGVYALAVARRTDCREIVCFEPDPMNRNQLGANIFLNGLDDTITVRAEAVSDRSGTATFYLQRDGKNLSSVQSRLAPFPGTDARMAEVTIAKLDDLLPFSGRNIAIKLDIEGHEEAALTGMTNLIARNRIYLQIEIWDVNLPRLQAHLEALGLRFQGQIMAHDYLFTKE